ncbi:U-box domain-containing protein 38-like [Silene latifolia]|uniref:U-box domain-containing protein 38-like n=1 Tax=Silene latifolia TaxID=37657 RepID=UPI003D77D2CC
MGINKKFLKLKTSLFRTSSKPPPHQPPPQPPTEYICPLCQTLITEPVVIASGHTFDRTCALLCQASNFTPNLPDGTCPDFSAVIPNLALQTAIPKWCANNGVVFPKTKSFADVTEKVRLSNGSSANSELTRKVNRFDSTSSDESVIVVASPLSMIPYVTRPESWNSSSSELRFSDDVLNPNAIVFDNDCDETYIAKFNSHDPYEQEQSAITLRKNTRNDEIARVKLCTTPLLRAMRQLLISSYEKVQVNAIAALVNLSLENQNKIKIVRSGIVPTIIDLLKVRLSETQHHAVGVIFSLSLEKKNRTAIGVLGALPPLLHCLIRSDSQRTRSDSALALYNLAFDYNNRVKLVKLGAVPALLAVMRASDDVMAGRVLLVLCMIATSTAGKTAMIDANAVEELVAVLRRGEVCSESTRENCVAALYTLSCGSLRFRVVAKEAKADEVLRMVEETGSERAKEKARRILVVLKGRRASLVEENDEVDWAAILDSVGA